MRIFRPPCLCASVVSLLLFLPACATRLATPSGGPEVLIHGQPLEQVKQSYCNWLADRGFVLRRHEGSIVEAEKNGDVGDNILFGDPAHPTTQKRIVLNFLLAGDDIRVLYHGFNVSHAYGDLELQGDWSRVQWQLECIAADLESRPRPSASPPSKSPRVSAR